MATGQRFEMPLTQWSAPAGPPYPGAKLNFYIASTSTRLDTFSDAALTVPNANPVVADGNGTFGPIYLQSRLYKVVLTTSADVQIFTADPVTDNVIPLVLNAVSGLVGINMTPVNVLDIVAVSSTNTPTIVQITNANAGTTATVELRYANSASVSNLKVLGSGYTPSGVFRSDGMMLQGNGLGGLTLNTGVNQPVYVAVNNTEVSRWDGSSFLVGSTAGSSARISATQPTAGAHAGLFINSNAAPNNAVCGYFQLTNSAPNDATTLFVRCQDSGANRALIYSNGGLGNFSANNVNLSDIRVKGSFELLDDGALWALERSFIAVDWARFKYDDQTHDDWNYGYSAQGVETAFAASVPAMTEVWNPTTTIEVDDGAGQMAQREIPTPVNQQLKGVFTEDLHNIAHALLARALIRISVLEERLVAAGIP